MADITVNGTTHALPDNDGVGSKVPLYNEALEAIADMLNTAPTFTAPTFQNSWVNFGGTAQVAGYTKDSQGKVKLCGAIKSGTMSQAAFTLPAGYRPAADEYFAVDSNGAYGVVGVFTDGTVKPVVGTNVSIWLSTVSFQAV